MEINIFLEIEIKFVEPGIKLSLNDIIEVLKYVQVMSIYSTREVVRDEKFSYEFIENFKDQHSLKMLEVFAEDLRKFLEIDPFTIYEINAKGNSFILEIVLLFAAPFIGIMVERGYNKIQPFFERMISKIRDKLNNILGREVHKKEKEELEQIKAARDYHFPEILLENAEIKTAFKSSTKFK